MEFRKYNSIENAYQKGILEQIIIHGFEKGTYIVQEKVHGANFSFFTDGKTIKIAKRTDFIQEREEFYNAQKILKNYQEKIIMLFEKVKEHYPEITHIVVYGELFGGSYKHPDVKTIPHAIKVQKGIEYCPDNEFYAFDIKLDNNKLVDVEIANEFFESLGFLYAKTLFKGSLKEALAYPNTFNSTIPEYFGLPSLTDNIAEGVVIKPIVAKHFGNEARVILKNKNEKWSEKSKTKNRTTVSKTVVFTPSAQAVWDELESYITTNRLYNVLSKIGEFHPKITGQLVGLFAKDVLNEFMKDQKESFLDLEKETQKAITKQLNKAVIKIIKEEFMTLKV
ncbi:RNA ligase, Rnl2 family [Flavobacterium sp. SUN046]|uniref:RNA ligase, Rnl2 family n=1 Tax=Flavobacterium sp. SUN046 TaxID=3002440 RepID=UPI002DBB3C81|nr:RNA ligase, Rnl2 family [Flavobacterium sp. SUN046]MEC4048603.1 RNA ligase, Rnl2 family [Flavobacterium sp. SUN046]